MAVSFTANIGLAEPDNNELAANWATGAKLVEDNNLLIIDHMDIPLTTYTASINAQTTAPNIGSGGTELGEYQDIEGIIMGSFQITFFGSGITSGSGEYGIRLPAVADNSFHNVGTAFNATPGPFSVIGEGFIYDASAAATSGTLAIDVVTVGGVSYARLLTEAHTTPAKTSRMVRDSMPIVLAADDRLQGNFLYKKL